MKGEREKGERKGKRRERAGEGGRRRETDRQTDTPILTPSTI